MEVKGCAAIVTGGGTGIGAAVAQTLSSAGARVTVLGRRRDVIKRMGEKIGGMGISCDVSDAESVSEAFAVARQSHGPARILINSAADGRLIPMLDLDGKPLPIENFREIISTNLLGPFYTTRLAAADMVPLDPLEDGSRGLIVNVSSIVSLDGAQGAIGYTASKGALDAMTLALARDFSQWGIRVVTVSPGLFNTPMADAHIPAEMMKFALQTIPFPKRAGRPEEFAMLVKHICENTFINGAVIRLDAAMRVPYGIPG